MSNINNNNWTDKQWDAYEKAKVPITVIMLESLILAAEAHSLGMEISKTQKGSWHNMAREATKELNRVVAEVEAI